MYIMTFEEWVKTVTDTYEQEVKEYGTEVAEYYHEEYRQYERDCEYNNFMAHKEAGDFFDYDSPFSYDL